MAKATIQVKDFPPVEVPIEVGDTPSQTFLNKHETCPRSAYLYRRYGGGPNSHEQNRGTVFHEFAKRATEHLIEQDEREIPPELAQDFLLAVLRDHPDLVMPAWERDDLRYMADHFARGSFFDPERILAVELPLTLRLGKWIVRCRPDLAELPGPWQMHVTDYKTMFYPSGGDFNERYFFQLQLYALALAFGEHPDFPHPLGQGVEEFRLFVRFPRTLWEEGIAYRDKTVTRVELTNFRLDLESQLERLETELESQRWEPVPGTHCSECPAPVECPIPRHLRPYSQVADLDRDGAEKLARWIVVQRNATARATKRLKLYGNERQEAVRAGRDLAYGPKDQVSEEIRDKRAMAAAVEASVRYGREFNLADHVTVKKSSRWDFRKVPPGQLPHEEGTG